MNEPTLVERIGRGIEPDHAEDVHDARKALELVSVLLRESARGHEEGCLHAASNNEADCDCGATPLNMRIAQAVGCALCGGLPDADIHQPGYTGARPHPFLMTVEQ